MTSGYSGGVGREQVGHRGQQASGSETELLAVTRSRASALSDAVGELLGNAERDVSVAQSSREERRENAERAYQRSVALARNRSAQQLVEHAGRATDASGLLATSLGLVGFESLHKASEPKTLDVASYVLVGEVKIAAKIGGASHTDQLVPAVLPLLGRGNISIIGPGESTDVTAAIHSIILRALSTTGPGQLVIESFDPKLRATTAPFIGLRGASEDLLPDSRVSPQEFESLLNELIADVRRISDSFRGRDMSLTELRSQTGQPIESYRLVCLTNFPAGVSAAAQSKLQTLLDSGPRCGVSFLIHYDPSVEAERDVSPKAVIRKTASIDLTRSNDYSIDKIPGFKLVVTKPTLESISATIDRMAVAARSAAAPSIAFQSLHPDSSLWSEKSTHGITALIGRSGHDPVSITLGDSLGQKHNILVSGAVGQGKSNLLMALVHSLSWRYGPDELEMYLLDLKEGLTLNPLAPHPPQHPEFLPHARVLGLESDQAYAASVLQELVNEFERRASVIKSSGDNIARYREANPDTRMPRVLVVIDEFHKLFTGEERWTNLALTAIEQLAREGRAYGIHLVLASQTLSGITALLAKQDGIFAQFPIRLALKNSASESRVVLDQLNTEAARLRFRGEVIVNQDFGAVDGNRRGVVVDANPAEMAQVRLRLWKHAPQTPKPSVFHGAVPACIADAINTLSQLRNLAKRGADRRYAVVGAELSIDQTPAALELSSSAGSHLAVLGTGTGQTHRTVLGPALNSMSIPPDTALGAVMGAALSLALQHPKCDAEFVVLDLLDDQQRQIANLPRWTELLSHLGVGVSSVERSGVGDYFLGMSELLTQRDHRSEYLYIVGLGLDRANLSRKDSFANSPADGLQELLKSGPSVNAHLLGWWSSITSFNDCLGYEGQGQIGGVLALGVEQSELTGLMGPFVTWNFTPNRGLLHQAGQSQPRVIVPFRPSTQNELRQLSDRAWDE